MKPPIFKLFYLYFFCMVLPGAGRAWAQADETFIKNIYNEALIHGEAYENLRTLCKDIGARLAGSAEAQMAVDWGYTLLNRYGFDKVYLQEIKVPHWERGTPEAGWIINEQGDVLKLDVLALGGSVATQGLLQGEVLEVYDIEALKQLSAKEVEGKVVFLSKAFDPTLLNTFKAYGACYPIRGNGTSEAGRLGAKAVIIRSLAMPNDDFPHTGTMHYSEDVPKIPGAAISTNNANTLHQWLAKGKVTLKLQMNCQTLEEVVSYNVIAELTGKDDKIISFGGHLDSWDVGEGAHDDGAGIVHAIEAIRILKKLGYKPNHTLRCVLFMNEENGNRGGQAYARIASEKKEEHICAIESDNGGFLPLGFGISASDDQLKAIQSQARQLENFELYYFPKGGGGVDIGPLKNYYPNIVQLGLKVNSQRYFNYHHSHNDVFEEVNKRELELGAAALAGMVYLMDNLLN